MPDNKHITNDASLLDKLFALLLHLLPHHLLSQLMHWLTRCEWRPLKNALIRAAIRIYDIDMSLAKQRYPESYPHFNAFFTRQLKAECRPISQQPGDIVSPVDGTVSQAGDIVDGRIFQAKGQDFSLLELLGGDAEWSRRFEGGRFATLYLSPRDYHRIHMPFTGELKRMSHVPGRLFSVSPSTTRSVPRLFSRNERVVNLFETELGPMAVIMVGAIFVASMDTVWSGTVAPIEQRINRWEYAERPQSPILLDKGAEMGRFNMGSTVILLFARDTIEWSTDLQAEARVEMGQRIARRLAGEPEEEQPTQPPVE